METRFLSNGNNIVLFCLFFCQWKVLLKLGGSEFFKMKYIPASEHRFVRDFKMIQSGSNFSVYWKGNTNLRTKLKFFYFIFSSILQRFLSVIVFVCVVETMFQENPSFRLVATNFRATNAF